jgi:plasmid stability protein
MTTTLHLPDDVASAVRRRAAAGGHGVAEEVVELVRKGLALSESSASAAAAAAAAAAAEPVPPVISRDPVTGLPLIRGAPNAPISRMTNEEIQAIIDHAQLEEDLERLGIPPRR